MTVSHTVLSKFLRKVSAVSLGQTSLDDGRRPVIWAVRDVELWNKVPEQNAALLARHYYRPAHQGAAFIAAFSSSVS
jgi:hypothetical protein